MELVAIKISPWQPVMQAVGNFTMTEKQDAPVDEDVQLMYDIAAGNQAALRTLIDKWKKPLINFFYRSLRSYQSSEDLAQTTFIKIYRAADRYEPRAKFSTFLFHVARRVLLNEFRRQKRKPMEFVDPTDFKYEAVDDPEVQRRLAEIEEVFQKAIVELPEKHRTALLFYKQQQLSYQEIAEIMNASENAVKTWIFRARARLKLEMEALR